MKLWPRFRAKSEPSSPLLQTKLTGRKPNLSSPAIDVRAGGHRVRAVSYGLGPRHSPTLVFLHEGLGSIAQWRDFPDSLASACGCNAIIYERWGHGGSDPLTGKRKPDFMDEEAGHALPDVLDAFGVERAILVGHSDGGSIALLFAGLHPERTLGVITLAAHVFVEDISIDGVREAVEAFETGDLETRLATYHGDNTETMFYGWADIWRSQKFREWKIDAELSKVRAPVLALQGSDDAYGTPEQLRRLEDGVAGSVRTVLIPDCGHITHRDGRETVMSEAVRFISEIKSALAEATDNSALAEATDKSAPAEASDENSSERGDGA